MQAANQLDTRRNVTFIANVSKNRTPRRRPSGNIADFAAAAAAARAHGWRGVMKRKIHSWSIFRSVYGLIDETVLVDFHEGKLLFSKQNDILNSYKNYIR